MAGPRRAPKLTGAKYGRDHRADVSLRVIADHVRSGTMMVADGIRPGNEGRGYVLRRILRRSIRNLRLLGGQDAGLMHELTDVAIKAMGEQYPELVRTAANIHTVIDAEEDSFLQTLRTGTSIFDTAVEETKRSGGATLAGDQAFKLHDTYGFPIDLTLEMASEQGLQVDEAGFRKLMQEQRDRAKKDARDKKTGNLDVSVLDELLTGRRQRRLHRVRQPRRRRPPRRAAGRRRQHARRRRGHRGGGRPRPHPFYAEGGGQLADHGLIRLGSGAVIEVTDVQAPSRASSCTAAASAAARRE